MMKFTQLGLLSQDDLDLFDLTYGNIVNTLLTATEKELGVDPTMTIHLLNLLDYNVPTGKKLRGLLHLAAYKNCAKNPSPKDMQLASVFGWLIEIMQGASLIADDIMDNSDTRRGKPCWYKAEGIGLNAVNDLLFLEQATYLILKLYFGDTPCYPLLRELIRDALFKTVLGQGLDLQTESFHVFEDKFSSERYSTIVKMKTSFYTIYTPILAALTLAGRAADQELTSQVKIIALQIGHYFQVQDDYLDCFGDDKETGKVGSDIREGKCTWLVVTAVGKADQEQMRTLKYNYGRDDKECVDTVVGLYHELKLPEEYHEFEERMFEELIQEIHELQDDHLQDILLAVVSALYQRVK